MTKINFVTTRKILPENIKNITSNSPSLKETAKQPKITFCTVKTIIIHKERNAKSINVYRFTEAQKVNHKTNTSKPHERHSAGNKYEYEITLHEAHSCLDH